MGRPIARNLVSAGYQVTVWNRTPERTSALLPDGARPAASASDALQSGIVLSVLADDKAVIETFLDSGILADAPPNTVHVNLATVSTDLARFAAREHEAHGVGYVAAPVFGRVPVAEAGNLNVLVAGQARHIDRVQPLLDVIGARTWRLGERPEQANIVKIIGNYLIATVIQSLGEAVSLAEHADVDPGRLIEVLTATLFPGPVHSAYGSMIADHRYRPAGFTTTLGRKDLHLALDAAGELGLVLPVGELLREIFDQAIREGRGEDDWAVIAEQQTRPDVSASRS
jgi:3-hydroxyisobutyrate dehydrogenase-like beta-hydroxyacid dehydrogenase